MRSEILCYRRISTRDWKHRECRCILLNSAVYTNFETGHYPDGWLLGDSGYSCKPWLSTDPKAQPTDPGRKSVQQVAYQNKKRDRKGVRCLENEVSLPAQTRRAPFIFPSSSSNVIIATARLHNKCVRRRIGLPALGDDDGDDDRDDNPCDHQERNEDNEGRVVRERLIASVFDT